MGRRKGKTLLYLCHRCSTVKRDLKSRKGDVRCRSCKTLMRWVRPGEERAVALRQLGMKNYAEYLRSKLWWSIRNRVLERDDGTCYCCPNEAAQVHHCRYSLEVMVGQDLSPLVSLCRLCHKIVEFYEDETKVLSLAKVNRRMNRLRAGTLLDGRVLDAEYRAIVG